MRFFQVSVDEAIGGLHHGDLGERLPRVATAAGTESGSLGVVAGWIEADLIASWTSGWAAWAAVDTGRAHGVDELPVKGGVAVLGRLPAAIVVKHGGGCGWRGRLVHLLVLTLGSKRSIQR